MPRGRKPKPIVEDEPIESEELVDQTSSNEDEKKKKKAKKDSGLPGSDLSSRISSIKSMNEMFASKHGNSLMTADMVSNFAIPRISSGILPLDIALGGGWPIGRFSGVFGSESTGKSALFLRAIANAQRTCGGCFKPAKLVPGKVETIDHGAVDSYVISCDCKSPKNLICVWVDAEGAWDNDWAERLGVIIPRLILYRPEASEKCIDNVEGLLDSAADIVVIDSIAQMTPTKELEDSAYQSKDNVGLGARIMNSALRKWNARVQKRWQESVSSGVWDVPTVWMINQTRENVGIMWGNKETRPGGKGQRFITSVDVRTSGGKSKGDEKLLETHQVELGFEVVKNKTAPARRKGTYKMCLVDSGVFSIGQILDFEDTLFHGLRSELVEQPSDKKYLFDGIEFLGRNKLFDYWSEHLDSYNEFKRKVVYSLCF